MNSFLTLLEQEKSLPDAFFSIARRHPRRSVFFGAGSSADYEEVAASVERLGAYLQEQGIGPGKTIAILSSTRREWLEADLAIQVTGAVSVSVYSSLPPPSAAYILFDCGATIVFAENQEQVEMLLALANEQVRIEGHEDREAADIKLSLQKIIAIENVAPHPLVVQYRSLTAATQIPAPLRRQEIQRCSPATIVYTSGTTGPPKGVVQSHGNHLSNVRQALESGIIDDHERFFLFLPLAHSFARLIAYLALLTGKELVLPAGQAPARGDVITRQLREAKASIIPVVPRFLEKIKERLISLAASSPWFSPFHLAVAAALQHSHATPPLVRPVLPLIFTRLVGKRIRRRLFGVNFKYCLSGGAKLEPQLASFYGNLDIQILQGYGLTEACVATNVCRLKQNKIGTVGPPLAHDIEVRAGADGEILIRGPNVTAGYHNRPTATKAVFDESGFLHTGDIGEIDEEGNLIIWGRKKEIIVTSGGRKISPSNIESRICSLPLVSNALVIGEARSHCIALIALNEKQVDKWLRESGAAVLPGAREKVVKARIKQHLQACAGHFAAYEEIKAFAIVPDFTVENGLLTPTYKLKREAIEEKYREEVEKLYTNDISQARAFYDSP